MVEAAQPTRAIDRRKPLGWLLVGLGGALGLRVGAAFVVTAYAARVGKPCVFGDTTIYVALARTINAGTTYKVSQWGVPHYALRTPGYPAFLAGCFALFGPSLLAARVVQAVLGVVAVGLVGRLTGVLGGGSERSGRTPAGIALGLAAVEPFVVALAALVLSEAVFVPLMMVGLWGLARLWPEPTTTNPPASLRIAVLTGVALGGAILARPSWALFVPLILAVWVVATDRARRPIALRHAALVALATAVVMTPWWVRNARVVGRFVPTALWVGASLYDGISPGADGSSDMRFVDAPDVRALGEIEQDRVFRVRAFQFARERPGRVLGLALIKFGRFWSPWPNAETLRNPWIAAGSAVVTTPVFGLIALGVWDRRRDVRALALLAGPLVYFCGLHLLFVSSIRYRIPGLVPALGLAGFGLVRLEGWVRGRGGRWRRGRRDPGVASRTGTGDGTEANPR